MPFGSEQWMYASGGFYPYEIDQSLRFNDDDSASLSRTPASASNQKTWTWSGWVKRGNLGINASLFSAHDPTFGSSPNRRINVFRFNNDSLNLFSRYYPNTTVYDSQVATNAVFRDASAWYHVVLAFDTTQATASNRVKIYVNGEQQTVTTSGTGYPELNIDYAPNCNQIHELGRYSYGQNNPFDGYLAEVNFIDGQALDATDFGEFKSGVWIPKSYSGTYGTNGFHLDFGNSGSLGADSSGNGNNWTSNNLAATDQVLDSPTNNFCTWNPLEKTAISGYSEGNTEVLGSSGWATARAAVGISSGKWYWEISSSTSTSVMVGLGNTSMTIDGATYPGDDYHSVGYFSSNGNKFYANIGTSYGAVYGVGDVIGVTFDADTGSLTFYKNGVSQGVAYTGLSVLPQFPVIGISQGTAVVNFGQDSSFAGQKTRQGNTDANGIGDFYYAPPAGYLALCTANLPDPAIDPAQDDVPADYFNTVLYTGNGSTQSITGVGFQPDLIWLKSRSQAYDHGLVDAVRGVTKFLESNTTDAEATVTNYTTSFDSDGFSLGVNNRFNQSSATNVAWNWLADGSGSSNTDGSITSTVSANQKAGFSIVSYTGNGAVTDQTVGHGLSGCEMVVVKNRSAATDGNWRVVHSALSPNYNLALNLTVAEFDVTASTHGGLGTLNTTSNTFTLKKGGYGTNNTNQSGVDYIAYCFHSVEGYSKFGSYTGNGSTDGPFVYTGFRPAFIMLKASTRDASWIVIDAERDQENVASKRLLPNFNSAESSGTHNIDFLSNGFKMRGTNNNSNGSGETYIYMVFAEMPFKYSNAR